MSEPIKAEAALDKQAKNCGTCKHDGNQDILRTSCTGCHHWSNWMSADKPEDKPAAAWKVGDQFDFHDSDNALSYRGEVVGFRAGMIVGYMEESYLHGVYDGFSPKNITPAAKEPTKAELKAEREAEELEKYLTNMAINVALDTNLVTGDAREAIDCLIRFGQIKVRLTKGSAE